MRNSSSPASALRSSPCSASVASWLLERTRPTGLATPLGYLAVKPVLLAQLSDLHLGAAWEGVDPVPRLERAIEAIRGLPNPVDGVVVSGDLSDNGSEESYRLARELLGRFEVPVHVLSGNHDDRARLRQAFDLPGGGGEPMDSPAGGGALRVVPLAASVPGGAPGAFEPTKPGWSDEELSREG